MRPFPLVDGPRAVAERGAVVHLGADLEGFWPSRRPHAFDEFCR